MVGPIVLPKFVDNEDIGSAKGTIDFKQGNIGRFVYLAVRVVPFLGFYNVSDQQEIISLRYG